LFSGDRAAKFQKNLPQSGSLSILHLGAFFSGMVAVFVVHVDKKNDGVSGNRAVDFAKG